MSAGTISVAPLASERPLFDIVVNPSRSEQLLRPRMLKELLRPVVSGVRTAQIRAQWRRANAHNRTRAGNGFPIDRVTVGRHTYGTLNITFFGLPDESVEIGHFCSIADGVHFIAGGEHDYRHLSTYPLRRFVLGEDVREATSRGKITVGDDVWIGFGTTILSGVTIGQGAVIAAHSVLTRDVPPYAVFIGGSVAKYRFPPDIVSRLVDFDYSGLTDDEIRTNVDVLYSNISMPLLDEPFFVLHSRSRSREGVERAPGR